MDPRAAVWDEQGDQLDELQRLVRVRRAALARFGLGAIKAADAPMYLGGCHCGLTTLATVHIIVG